MIHRDFDAARINEILNDPTVRGDVAGKDEGRLDLTKSMENTNNVVLLGDHGGCVLIKIALGVYEVHTQCLREGRGAWAYQLTEAVTRWMFTNTDCYEIVTRIPRKHLAARHLAIRTGLKFEFAREMECVWRGIRQAVDIYSFRIQDWASKVTALDASGSAFHEFLHAEAARIGVKNTAHDDDHQHNRYVGIALSMIEGGHPQKAVNFYNRWAMLVRHQTVSLINTDPVTIRFDIGDLVFDNGRPHRVVPLDITT